MKNQSDLDISTKVMYKGRIGTVIYNRSRQGNEVVIVEWDDDFTVWPMNVNDLSIKMGGESWVSMYDLGKKKV